jgi:hypothetical protein
MPYCLSFAGQSPVLTVVVPDWPFFLAAFFRFGPFALCQASVVAVA